MVELSVVIATYNHAEQLGACLDALARQTQPSTDFEIIVVDDGSTDRTRDVLASYEHLAHLHCHAQPHRGVGAARNKGAELSVAPYCLFLDDDVVAAPDLVADHLGIQRSRDAVVGLGRLDDRLPVEAGGVAGSRDDRPADHRFQSEPVEEPPGFMACHCGNLSVPRDVFLRVGRFAVDLPHGEDIELGYRLHRAGLPFAHIACVAGRRAGPRRFRDIAAETERAGVAAVELYRRHAGIFPYTDLAGFGASGMRERLVRKMLLALRPPVRLLELLSRAFDPSPWRRSWHGLLQSYFYWRGARSAAPDEEFWGRLTDGTRILIYHAAGNGTREPPGRFVVSAGSFARQMKWVKRRGYRVLTFEEYLGFRLRNDLPPRRSVILTFDDGYADFQTGFLPVLRRYGFPATIFVVSAATGARNSWDADGELAGRALLSWQAIKEMQHCGVAYGAHTRSHPALTSIPSEAGREEISGCRADLLERLGSSPPVFSYPYGKYDAAVQAEVRRAGFMAACSVEAGLNGATTPLFALRRTEIYGTDTLLDFAYTLWTGRRPRWNRRRRRP